MELVLGLATADQMIGGWQVRQLAEGWTAHSPTNERGVRAALARTLTAVATWLAPGGAWAVGRGPWGVGRSASLFPFCCPHAPTLYAPRPTAHALRYRLAQRRPRWMIVRASGTSKSRAWWPSEQ